MKTLTEKFRGVLNESFSKKQFVRDARMEWPQLVNQFTGFNDAVAILKQKGMISEEDKMPEYAEYNNLSDEAIRRGVDAELEAMGLMSHDKVSEEDQAKAKEKALKNLKKNPLHYLDLLSGESNKVDKHDKMVEPTDKNKVDTFNGMKKAELKESYNKVDKHDKEETSINEYDQTDAVADYIKDHYRNPKTGKSLIDDEVVDDFYKTHPEWEEQADGSKEGMQAVLDNFEQFLLANYEMPGDYMQEKVANSVEDVIDPADYGMIGQGYLKGFNRPHSLDADQLETLGRKIVDSLYKGDFDAAKAKFVGEVMGIDRKGNQKPETGGSDATKYKAAAKNMEEELSDEDMKAIEKYGRDDKPVKAFKPGDMFSSDFDYEGMLEFGMKIRLNTPIATLQGLYNSFEDVNYHSENSHLGMAIDAIQDGDKSEALDHIRNFKKAIKKTLIQFNEGANPNRDVEEYVDPKSKLFRPGSTDDGEEMNERVGSLQEFISLIEDRADETGFEPREEAAEVIEALADHYKLNLKMIQNYIDSDDPVNPFAENEGVSEKKGKDHDGDGDVDGDDYMAAKDKAIKKAMGKEVSEELDGDDEHTVHELIGDLFAPGNARYHLDMPVEKIAKALEDYKEGLTAQGVKDAMDLYDKLAADGTLEKEVKDGDGFIEPKHVPKLKKAFGLIGLYGKDMNESVVRKNLKSIITKVLEEEVINEAATQELAKMADSYAGFDGMKGVVMSLQDIVTDIERFFDNTRGKIQKAFNSMGEVRNEEGLKVGGFLSPAVESAFNKDLRPVVKQGFTKGLEQPKVKVLSQADLDAARRGGPVAEAEPKQTVYSPVNEKKK